MRDDRRDGEKAACALCCIIHAKRIIEQRSCHVMPRRRAFRGGVKWLVAAAAWKVVA